MRKPGSLLREIEELLADGRASPMAFVIVYAGLGDLDAAFRWLETAFRIGPISSGSPTGSRGSTRFARTRGSAISSAASDCR